MFGNLQSQTEDQLLTLLLMILSKPTVLSARDATEIDQIETEFLRREQYRKMRMLLDVHDPFTYATSCHERNTRLELFNSMWNCHKCGNTNYFKGLSCLCGNPEPAN